MYKSNNTINVYYDVWGDGKPVKRIWAYGDGVITQSTDSTLKTSFRGTFWKYSGVNFIKDRLRVTVEINGVSYPMGVFCVTTETPTESGGVSLVEIEAYSLLWILEQCKLERKIHFQKDETYTGAIKSLLAGAGFVDYDIEESGARLATEREDWEVGTTYLKVINDLLSEINYNRLFVTPTGKIRATKYQAPSVENVTHTYTEGKDSVIKREYRIENDFYKKSNVFIVICNNPELEDTLRAEAVNDDVNSPYSVVNMGRRVPYIERVNNTPSLEELQQRAENLKMKSNETNETITFETAIIPTHTTYDTVMVNVGDASGVYRETGYEITLGEGGTMTHTGTRVRV